MSVGAPVIAIKVKLFEEMARGAKGGRRSSSDIADVFTQRMTAPFHIYKNAFIPNGLFDNPTSPVSAKKKWRG